MTNKNMAKAGIKPSITKLLTKIKNSTRKSGYNTYRGWTQIDYQNKHYNKNQRDEGT
jgi:hypothetical protein